jgi:hypothetical protein
MSACSSVVQHRPAIDTPVGVPRLGRFLDLAKLCSFLAVLHVGDMRANQLPDFATLVLSRLIEVDEHEFGHVVQGLRAGYASAVACGL